MHGDKKTCENSYIILYSAHLQLPHTGNIVVIVCACHREKVIINITFIVVIENSCYPELYYYIN